MDDTTQKGLEENWNQSFSNDGQSLSQDAINRLFESPEGSKKNTPNGLQAILDSGQLYSERFPILDVVYERLMHFLTASLRNFTSDNVEINCSRITAVRLGDYLNSIPLPAVIAVFTAIEWKDYGLIVFESNLIYAVIEVLLGGRKSSQAKNAKADSRGNTLIERTLVEQLINMILEDFKKAFEPISAVRFRYERLETNPRFATVTGEKSGVLVVNFSVSMEERGGKFSIVLPYATIEPVKDLLQQNITGEKFGKDNIWEDHLKNKLLQADLLIEAILPQEEITLGELLTWQEGTHFMLSSKLDSPITLKNLGHDMMQGHLGKRNNNIAVKIDELFFGRLEDKNDVG